MSKEKLKKRLDEEVKKRDSSFELCEQRPDPMLVAREYKDEYISLICALFAYGNAGLIVKFLRGLDFSILSEDEKSLRSKVEGRYYRFQNSEDIAQFFITLKRSKEIGSLNDIFLKGYNKNSSILEGLNSLISTLLELNSYRSHGYNFLIGSPPTIKSKSTYKRWNMYLRWMVREDNIDLGLWRGVKKSDLLVPLDTHTFKVSQKLGLIKRKSYDLKAVLELSDALREFDREDPIKYDFALYRLGQEGIV